MPHKVKIEPCFNDSLVIFTWPDGAQMTVSAPPSQIEGLVARPRLVIKSKSNDQLMVQPFSRQHLDIITQ